MYRYSYIEINTKIILANLKKIKNVLKGENQKENSEICATVKANAYGFGLTEISKLLYKNGVRVFGVTSIEEALTLRAVLKNARIIIYSPFPMTKENVLMVEKNKFTILLSSENEFKKTEKFSNKKIDAFIKYDVGMNRLGFKNLSELNFLEKNKKTKADKNINIIGLFTHLPNTSKKNDSKTLKQIASFNETIKHLQSLGVSTSHISIFNSSGIFNYFKRSKNLLSLTKNSKIKNFVRPGFALYDNAMSVKTKIIDVKELKKGEGLSYINSFVAKKQMIIGVLPIGYADGISFSNKNLSFFVNKKQAKVLAVNMDHTYIDITSIFNRKAPINLKKLLYKEVSILVNTDKSKEKLSNELNTFPYELYTKLGNSRLEKIYKSI